ncbi:molybdenum cofactor biosynthesis protein MoaE [Chitinophaga polysaccharea]|uniref:molybdenum cofactor biosynthesis protein MoaE n=1 Tax=Chitinophaga TaxID=79328 RepID=UPI001455509B|nr:MULTISPECIES: molybdenum cofactor biosynthesis protein MoaE [Chitinophaga]NLR61691.1 molybdenum cofactor biosynthesis protein MoaE [Chitinophaga polysaccharea]NLU93714.1 molybdenum cofactor biosynthesis protein MoaE [Chitinophaga sp. Ak27]
MEILINIKDTITVQEALDFIQSPACGGEVIFTGTVRNHTKQRSVLKLFYECYEAMAISEMQKIAMQVQERWDIQKLVMLHAVGDKYPGDIAVVIAVAAAHRGIAFDACEYVIDTLKETVPIWKKEFFADGEIA